MGLMAFPCTHWDMHMSPLPKSNLGRGDEERRGVQGDTARSRARVLMARSVGVEGAEEVRIGNIRMAHGGI